MPIEKKLLDQLRNKTYNKSSINLCNKNLKDTDVDELINLLAENSDITELDLSNNQLTEKTVVKLAANTTLKTLRIKPGNPEITLSMLGQFLNNTSLTCLPFRGGSGSELEKLRQHIKNNATRPKLINKVETNVQHVVPEINVAELPEQVEPESGQDSFLSFSFNLLFDMENFNSAKEYIVWYAAIALNLYLHNASHKPVAGYGKAQALEEDHALYYSRSQTDHPNRIWHDKIAKNKNDTRKISVSPINAVLRNLIAQTIQPDDEEDLESKKGKRLRDKRRKLIATLNAIEAKRGFPSANKKIKDYFSLFLAHAGLRVNNLRVLINALEEVSNTEDDAKDIENLRKKLIEILPKRVPKKITKLDDKTVKQSVKEIQQRFSNLKQITDTFAITSNLQKQILKKRKLNNAAIFKWNDSKKLPEDNMFRLEANGPGCVCIIIDKQKIGFAANITSAHLENFTNVVLGFFQGLIHYHAKLLGLLFRVDRRQSFGFLNSTLTDAGELTLRLSLGVEPEIFNRVIWSSLKDLQQVLKNKELLQEQYPGMRSEKKQWQAGFEAQFYLEQESNNKNTIEVAFKKYVEEFIFNDKEQVTAPTNFNPIKQPAKNQTIKNAEATPLFAILRNLVKYATEFAVAFSTHTENALFSQFGHSYLHGFLKLYQHCNEASDLLNNLENQELSLAYKEAINHVQNIMEYLIALDSLQQIKEKMLGKENTRLNKLLITEKKHATFNFNLADEQVNVYLLDNGQQAITTSLLAMDWELFLQGAHEQRGQASIYNFNESYYELDLFLTDVGGLKNTDKKTSTVLFIDIIQLNNLQFKDFPNVKVLVIDITRQPDLTDKKLNQIIDDAHKLGLWVVLSASCLKHDELGTDKYTAGKIITLAPDKKKQLNKDVIDIFESISNHSMHPAVASYLQIVNEVCGDKMYSDKESVKQPIAESQLSPSAKKGLQNHGLLKTPAKPQPSQERVISTMQDKKTMRC